jgi:ParB family chromosome partitioning protein
MTKQALGRGFEGLIPTNFDVSEVASPGEHIRNIELSKIIPNPDQPRKDFDNELIKELSVSIKQHGIIQPLVVTPQKDKYRIVAGERRYRASELAGLKKVPVVIRNHEELEELEIALVENVQRVDLSPIEQALSIVKLHEQFSMSYKDISKKLGKAETTISNIVRLLQLPKPAIDALRKNKISEGHARAILALKTDEKLQLELLNKIITQGMSVRQAEAFVHTSKSIQKPVSSKNKLVTKHAQVLLKGLNKSLTGKVTISEKTEKTGSITIKYSNTSELDDLFNKINS